ncbi:uncharacterized protein BCR38DRAFT_516032 [Pseudomassariella vexata]|uniref:Pathogen-related protein n=1 Tax=Pseudomassariella vexata TaxID=1141098 RepID=A0A1Y2DUX1_9PEZI|nr:uncharacterized protein BCR38DRAFT_516032 [Pseudomassariella vexata]ORY63080.1 hypothetical protein BCR38DRAFT_516032 [Pseudomassariella vexata]
MAAEVATAPAVSEAEKASPPALPDYMTDPNAVLKDLNTEWRYGRPPDYSNTRRFFAQTKKCSHEPGRLPDLVQNLVKNWEIEASFKTRLSDWRTVDPGTYSFSVNGSPPQSGEHMLKVGTYNAIIVAPNEWYSPRYLDLASSHKTFKRMMPTFAWEMLEVYSGPPVVAFKWRHWGEMKDDYVGWNDKGEKVMVKAHGGPIDIQGVTVAHLSDKMQVKKLETWFDPVELFRQISPAGVVRKDLTEAAAAMGCPVTGYQVAEKDKASVDENVTTLEKEAVVLKAQGQDKVPTPGENLALETASLAGRAVMDSGVGLPGDVKPTEANPENGEIPRPNAE